MTGAKKAAQILSAKRKNKRGGRPQKLKPCPHHTCEGARARLCDVVRRARRLTGPWSRDIRVTSLLAALVRAHELDARGSDAERDRQAERIAEQVAALDGVASAPARRAA